MKKTNIRWIVGLFIFLATTINYIDRSVLGLSGPSMMEELGISKIEFGVLSSAFFWSYCAMQIPSGIIADKIGTKITYIIAIIWWSGATILTGVSRTFGMLIGARVLMGAGEAPAFPANTRMIAEWMPASERGKANSLITAAIATGAGLLNAAVAWLILAFGWRNAFIACGAIGFVFSAVLYFYFKEKPEEDKKVNREELEYIRSGQPKPLDTGAMSDFRWYQALKYSEIWVLCFGVFTGNYLNYMMLTWLPTYLVGQRGMTLLTAGFASMAPFLAMFGGAILGGSFSDYLVTKKAYKPLRARKVTLASGMLLMTVFILPAPYITSNIVALGFMSAAMFSIGMIGANVWAAVADISPKNAVAGVAGFQNFVGQFSGIIAPIATGFLVQATNNYNIAFNINGVLGLISALLYIFCIKEFQLKNSDTIPKKHGHCEVESN
jgi:MFS transporter, ACS family, D-galactonate transporter